MAFEIEAQVPGRVVRIERVAGDAVAAEDIVLVLESMKMEVPVEAPVDGSIAEILVSEGESVVEGQPLARLD